MGGLLRGIGVGAAFLLCMAFPLPLLIGGVAIWALAASGRSQRLAQQEPQGEEVDLSAEELAQLQAVLELMENSSDPGAIWEEFNA